MRTTIELPDAIYRQIKARAALQGLPVKALVGDLLQRGLMASEAKVPAELARSLPPTVTVNEPFPLALPTNAALFELLDDPGSTR